MSSDNKYTILQLICFIIINLVLYSGLSLSSIGVATLGFIAIINLEVVKIISR